MVCDNPMASDVSCHIGTGGNKICRRCEGKLPEYIKKEFEERFKTDKTLRTRVYKIRNALKTLNDKNE